MSRRLRTKRCGFLLAVLLVMAGVAQAQPDPQPLPGGPPNLFFGAIPPGGTQGPVVLFVHALGSNAQYWWLGGNTMYRRCYDNNYRTAFLSFNADNTANSTPIAQNAAIFQQFLPQVTSHYNVEQVYVVAMSKGGLDAQVAMLDSATLHKVRGLFTLATPNNGDALADWAYKPGGVGSGILQTICNNFPGLFCPLSPGLEDLQTPHVQALRAQIDPVLRSSGIPVYTLASDSASGNLLMLATSVILKGLTGLDNDGLVTVPETLLDEYFAFNMGQVRLNHFSMGQGDPNFAFVKGRIDGFEYAKTGGPSGFHKVASGGLGDANNTWFWTMRWFKGKLYVGSGRNVNCVISYTAEVETGVDLYPADSPCPPDPKDLQSRAEIWQYTPQTKTWLRVFQSPMDIPIGLNLQGQPAFTARDIGFRDIFVFTEADGTQALYAGGVTANSMFGNLPDYTPNKFPPPRILRSLDGVNWTPIPQTPGTFMGDLVKNNDDVKVVSYRSFQSYKGKLFVNATTLRGQGFVIASSNPSAGDNAWKRVTPYPTPGPMPPVWDLQVFNNFLYAGVGDRLGAAGYGVFKTDATALDPTPCPVVGCQPYVWTQIVPDGAYQTVDNLRSPIALTLAIFQNKLYVGTDRKTEMIRINPDDTWELVAGEPRRSPTNQYIAPISGIGIFFGNGFNQHFWQMAEAFNGLHMGTWDFGVLLKNLDPLSPIFPFEYGMDLFRTIDGIHWNYVNYQGLGDGMNFGGRSMERTPFGFFVGTARPGGGAQVWLDQRVLDYNLDGIIDHLDVDTVQALVGQSATGPTDGHDLDQDGLITAQDVDLLSTQCTFPDCTSLPPAAHHHLTQGDHHHTNTDTLHYHVVPPGHHHITEPPPEVEISPPILGAESELTSGRLVKLGWSPVAGAVQYRVYRFTVLSVDDFLNLFGVGGATLTVPGAAQPVVLPQDALNGKLNSICTPALDELPACIFNDMIKSAAASPTSPLGFPTAPTLIATVPYLFYIEVSPTLLQSIYFVRAEDANGNLSEPSNIVGAPSKAAK